MTKLYTVHVTDEDGNEFCLPGVTDCAFITLPNGDGGLAFKNPYGDDFTESLSFLTIRKVTEGYTPNGEPCYHKDGPVYENGHRPENPYGHQNFPNGPFEHEAFE